MSTLVIAVNFNNCIEIGPFLDELVKWHPREDIVVVDDGSTDGSMEKAAESGLRLLRHEKNRGVGAAIRTGIQYARAGGRWDSVVVMSCNGKMKPSEIPAMIRALDNADYVQGNRFLKGNDSQTPWDRWLGITFFSLVGGALLGRRFSDLTCGFRCYRLSIFNHPRLEIDQPWLDRYEMEYFIHFWACRLGLRIVEIPVSIGYGHLPRRRFTKIKPFIGWWSMFRPLFRLSFEERPRGLRSIVTSFPLAMILLVAAAVRIPGILSGVTRTPWAIHARNDDEFSLSRVTTAYRRDVPSDFPYPRAYVLASAAACAAVRLPPAPFDRRAPGPILVGRAVSALFGVLTVGLLFVAMKRGLRDPSAATFGALFLALCPLHVTNSHYGTADAMMVFFDTGAVVAAMAAVATGRLEAAMAAAAACGLALATKMTPFAVAPVLIAGMSLCGRTRPAEAARWIAVLGAGVAAFVLANGHQFDEHLFQNVIGNIRWDNMDVKDHVKIINPPFFLLLLTVGMGAPAATFAVWAIARWRHLGLSRPATTAFALVVAPTAVIYLAMISTLSIPYSRHLLPLVPLACAVAGLGFAHALSRLPSHQLRNAAVAGVLLYQLLAVVSIERSYVNDPADAADAWLRQERADPATVFRPKYYAKDSNTPERLATAEYVVVPDMWSHLFERSVINPLGAPDCASHLYHQGATDCETYHEIVSGGAFVKAASFDMHPVVPEQIVFNRIWGSYPVFTGRVRIYRRAAS